MSTCYQLLMMGTITQNSRHQIVQLKRKMTTKKMIHGKMMKILLNMKMSKKKTKQGRMMMMLSLTVFKAKDNIDLFFWFRSMLLFFLYV